MSENRAEINVITNGYKRRWGAIKANKGDVNKRKDKRGKESDKRRK